jgi:hypothetical protein
MRPVGPPAILPTSASGFTELRGHRIIVGVPGVGFRGDLRADDPVLNGGRTFVPVLTEQDYYRAEIDQLEVFAPLVPVERVWVEVIIDDHQYQVFASGALDAPQPRRPVPAVGADRLFGSRLVRSVPDGYVRNLRAVTDVYIGPRGATVRMCDEMEWHRWGLAGLTPTTTEAPAVELWLE